MYRFVLRMIHMATFASALTQPVSLLSTQAFLERNTNKKFITLSPGGLAGFYMLGIVTYIQENYDTSEFEILGASAGAWNSLPMVYKGSIHDIAQDILCNYRRIAGEDDVKNEFNGTWFANYSFGPVSIGYSTSYVDAGLAGSAEATTNAKTVGTSAGIFESEAMSIAFNVNDNLSVSYSETEDVYNAQDNASTAVADVTMDIESLQVAYSMGSMSIKAYRTESSSNSWSTLGGSMTKNEIALGISF